MTKSKFHCGSNIAKNILNQQIQTAFYAVLDNVDYNKNMRFIMESLEHGTKQWADMTDRNVIKCDEICPNCCLYCYAASNATVRLGASFKDSWVKFLSQKFNIFSFSKLNITDRERLRPPFALDQSKLARSSGKSKECSLIMLPSSHDIFPELLDFSFTSTNKKGQEITYTYMSFIKTLLERGNELLITSKPRIDVIKRLCNELADFKEKITFRFTITTNETDISGFWETFAPTYEERLESLRFAKSAGFTTTISMEPFLSDPRLVIKDVDQYVTQIWIGIMSKIPRTSLLGIDITKEKDVLNEIKRFEALYSSQYIKNLVSDLRSNPKIFWKESVISMVLNLKQNERKKVPSKVPSKNLMNWLS